MKLPSDFSSIKFSLACIAWVTIVVGYLLAIGIYFITGQFIDL